MPDPAASASPRASTSRLKRWWDAFLLRPAERRVRSYSAQQSRTIRELADAAQLLLDADDAVAGVELARDAAALYARAAVVATRDAETESKPDAADAWETFDRQLESGVFGPPPASFQAARDVLFAADVSAWAELPVEQAQARADSIEPALRWLRGLVEPRSLSRVTYQRWRRIAALTLAAIGLVSFTAHLLLSPRNLALRRPVQFSSKHGSSIATDGELVDGVINSTYGVHTGADQPPWVMVDLGRPRKIRLVKIYNRGDAAFDESLPMTLEFSEDAQNFEEIDNRTTGFRVDAPWTVTPEGKTARYIRVRGRPGGYVVLNELEAYE